MAQGKLRKDLYYRLNVVNISIPSLKERSDDIPILAEKFLEKHNKRFEKEIWMISDEAIKRLKAYDYPGNVRELENIIEQAVSMVDKEHILTDKLLLMPTSLKRSKALEIKYEAKEPLDRYINEVEKRVIKDTFIQCAGNISKTAQALQIKRQTLQHKLKKYGISQ